MKAWGVSRVLKMGSVGVKTRMVHLLLEGRIVSRQDMGGWRYSRAFSTREEMDVVLMYAVCVFVVHIRGISIEEGGGTRGLIDAQVDRCCTDVCGMRVRCIY